jgi:predicted HTH domain antitoxin
VLTQHDGTGRPFIIVGGQAANIWAAYYLPREPRSSVSVTVQIPAAIAPRFGPDPEGIARRILEQAALEGYRSNQLSRGQVAEMLGLDWAETAEFLAKHRCDRRYDIRDLEEDRHNLDRILGPA